jgi:hypothetical protein
MCSDAILPTETRKRGREARRSSLYAKRARLRRPKRDRAKNAWPSLKISLPKLIPTSKTSASSYQTSPHYQHKALGSLCVGSL